MIGLVGGEAVLITITYQSIYGDTYVEHATTAINSNAVRKLYKEYKIYTEEMKQLKNSIQYNNNRKLFAHSMSVQF